MNRAQLKKAQKIVNEATALDKTIREIDAILSSVSRRKREKEAHRKVTTYRVSIYACTPDDPYGHKRGALSTEITPGGPVDEFLSVLRDVRQHAKVRLTELSL